jgi:hypothetical protein
VAVIAVLAYNRLQEGRVRREAERAFSSGHADVLMGQEAPPAKAVERPAADPRVDYVIQVSGPIGEGWDAMARRFGPRALLEDGRASLQMVSRNGVVSEADLLEFRTQVETLAKSVGAAVSAPDMREALEGAYALDRACAEADVQVAVHVLGVPQDAGVEEGPYQVAPRADGVTLLLDVPRTRDVTRSYEAMVRAGRQLATTHGGRLVDDNANPLDDAALVAIGTELDAMRRKLAEIGIEPGSPLALRLFS